MDVRIVSKRFWMIESLVSALLIIEDTGYPSAPKWQGLDKAVRVAETKRSLLLVDEQPRCTGTLRGGESPREVLPNIWLTVLF